MSRIKKVLEAMPFDQAGSPDDIAVITKMESRDVSDCMKLLEQGGLIECVNMSRYIKNRKYMSRQRSLI